MGFVSCRVIRYLPLLLLLVIFVASCTEEKFLFVINRNNVKNFPADTPFVYNTEIRIQGKNISKGEKASLLTNLPNYFDDSIRVLKAQRFGIFYRIKNPPIFDTAHMTHSISFMNSYLNSIGYYHTTFRDSFYIDTFRKQESALM